jgi:transposase
MLNTRLVPDEQEEITPGEAMAGMILNGLGCANRPLSLPPQFFANTPLDLLLREGIRAEMLHRFPRGRTLDEVSAYGGDRLCSECAVAGCVQEGIALRFQHLDTTSGSWSGDDMPDSEAQASTIPHGDSKDHRPDLQQAVLALLVSQDGGVPVVRKSWEGHAADTQMFQERAGALLQTLQKSPQPGSLVADATLYHEENAPTLATLGCITRMPGTLTRVSQVLRPALTGDRWQRLDDTTRSCGLALCHDGMAQRWLVGSSQAALARADTRVDNACQRESATIHKPRFPLPAQRFETPEAAQSALRTLATSWRSHQGAPVSVIAHQRSACTGRPAPTTPSKSIAGQRDAQSCPAQERMRARKQHGAGVILGTHIASRQLSAPEVMHADTAPSRAAGGVRLLTDPRFFVSALCVKKPYRIQGLLMVMTVALLGYAVTQRRLRQPFARQNETLPHQIHQPTERPTVRWVFQLLAGIHRVRVTRQSEVHDLSEGLKEVQSTILRLVGQEVCRLYQISPG